MNCRTFQKNLEDYLENHLDFAGRFGMERHAQQCIRCGREMTDAQRLSQLVRNIPKVKAPSNFESTVLNAIGKRKQYSRFPIFRQILVFGFDMPSWRQYAFAASVVLLIGMGLIVWRNLETRSPSQPSDRADVEAVENPSMDRIEQDRIPSLASTVTPRENTIVNQDGVADNSSDEEPFFGSSTHQSEYREYRAIGRDNLPVIIPLPDRIHMQVTPPPEAYFIRNVSH